MEVIKKQCSVCNKMFNPCERCIQLSALSSDIQWRRVVCCPQHFEFHMPIINYVRGNISKDDAAEQLIEAMIRYGEPVYNSTVEPIVNEILS